jgi:hypothetical protein
MAAPLAQGSVHQPDKGRGESLSEGKAKPKVPKKDTKKREAK